MATREHPRLGQAMRRWLTGCFAASLLVVGCDDESDDEMSSTSRDVPAATEGCPNEDDADGETPIGETRSCTCDDGTESTQMCLSSGAFGLCQCDGGGW